MQHVEPVLNFAEVQILPILPLCMKVMEALAVVADLVPMAVAVPKPWQVAMGPTVAMAMAMVAPVMLPVRVVMVAMAVDMAVVVVGLAMVVPLLAMVVPVLPMVDQDVVAINPTDKVDLVHTSRAMVAIADIKTTVVPVVAMEAIMEPELEHTETMDMLEVKDL